MIPVVTPEEMGAIDRAAPEPVDELIDRAARAVARAAIEMLGGTYGRRVLVVAGKGNNGNDGREAAKHLRRRGVRVRVLDAASAPTELPAVDLVIDAAYGTGFHGAYEAPRVHPGQAVLAVDIPSGVDGRTGAAAGRVLPADRTVTFAASKPGLLLEPGASLAGAVTVADIGLDTSGATLHLVEAADVSAWLPTRSRTAHKWQSAVWVVAGSPGMSGAAALATGGAQRAGAGYVRLSAPGGLATDVPVEVVQDQLTSTEWSAEVLDGLGRFGALVIGNGLGTTDTVGRQIRAVVAGATLPVVVDADGLTALAADLDEMVPKLTDRVVLTPHDGEFARLAGGPPGADRIGAARDLAARLGAVVLLKGHLTVVAHPDGRVLLSDSGDARLATAGTGDVLAGVIGALAAQGMEPFEAAAAGACIHGRAGALGWRHGLVAGDLVELLPDAFDQLAFDQTGADPFLLPPLPVGGLDASRHARE